MNLRHFSYLAAAIELGSLSRAAAQLGVSQPAMSKGIAALESQLEVTLLKRSNRGVTATAAGLKAARQGMGIVAQTREIADAIDQPARRANANSVRVGCGPSEATRLLPMALAALHSRHPAMKVTVLYGLNEDLMPLVKRGDVDFALSSVPRTASDPALQHDLLHQDSAAIVASPNHPAARLAQVQARTLQQYPWVLARRHELERRALDDLFFSAGIKPPDATIETTSAVLMKAAVMQGDYLSFLPRELIHWEEKAGLLVCITVDSPLWQRQVGITRRIKSRTRRAARLLSEELARCAIELASSG